RLECDLVLFDADLPEPEIASQSRAFDLAAILVPRREAPGLDVRRLASGTRASGKSTVTLLTSGSTGRPKPLVHTWSSLGKTVRLGCQGQSARWLLTYRPHLYAGLQVALQCFGDGGALVVPVPHQPPAQSLPLIESLGVQFVSATPSFWKHLL